MPWSHECRSQWIKQRTLPPTEAKLKRTPQPGPSEYTTPTVIGGKGFSHIRRAPAYSFGLRPPLLRPGPGQGIDVPLFDVCGFTKLGPTRLTHGVMSARLAPPCLAAGDPGPAAYRPRAHAASRRPPAYSMRPAASDPPPDPDVWTPSPNMYLPPVPGKSTPAFTLGSKPSAHSKKSTLPGPGGYNPNFNYVLKTVPRFGFGAPYRKPKTTSDPSPTYCHKRFMYDKKSTPAYSFGIKHSKYLGEPRAYLKESKLTLPLAQ
ncbi:hypothetical protein JYU34_003339 [Plutella xylostella]|uniref:Outer dense fiber protein 3-like protein 2 n=1 Tax=Plutella xylostella TaxID=51655 RepID=A0ABQ7QZT0_PLUXY|nr:hypothetical protein JYU34_003339 [Plutella xylostella]